MTRYIIRTETGSEYIVRHDGADWWLTGINVVSHTSGRLPGDREWRIKQPSPWPPMAGASVLLASIYSYSDRLNPDRIPGGGKWTSRVTEFSSEEMP